MTTPASDPYTLSADQINSYRRDGFVKLKGVLSESELATFDDAITRKVIELNTMHLPMEDRSTYDKAFLQVMNLWRTDDIVKRLVFDKRLARIAAELMGVEGVRLYHDQALYKEPSGGFTPWHADQYYWPLASEHCVTAWIPLQETPVEMGPLEFSAGSHRLATGRDLRISDESERVIQELLGEADLPTVGGAFDAGEVSFHAGWLFHRAGPNTTETPRRVMCIIYMDADMKLKRPENENQIDDWEAWCPGARIGETIQTPLNPVLWP
ncbi:MAG: phytanoyl-CoA dioxygenase family protein [Rhodothermales bacterium]